MPTILWLILALIVASILLVIITEIVNSIRLKNELPTLWEHIKPLERFTRPNSRHDYQYELYKDDYDTYALIDDKTWNDLDMPKLFSVMNFNFTAIGEMRLVCALRHMKKVNNEKLFHVFNNNDSVRNFVAYHLAKIGKSIYPTFPDQLQPVKRNNFYMLSTYLPLIGIIITLFNTGFGIMFLLLVCIYNMALSDMLKRTYIEDLNSMFYNSSVVNKAYKLSKSEDLPDIDVDFKHFIVARRFSWLLGKASTDNDAFTVIGFIKMLLMLDYFLFHLIQSSFKRYENEVLACYDYIAMLDNHYSIALWRKSLDFYSIPKKTNEDTVEFDELVHPLLNNAVPNSLTLDFNMLLTGSNASGKSTFMKALALNLLLAQSVNTTTAQNFVYKPGLIYTAMVNQDSITSGDSYFMTELKSINRLFEIPQNQNVYCFIDEIFKGTNTTERIAASESVLSYLNDSEQFTIIAATHDIELADLLQDKYANYHFNESIMDNEIHFDFTIKTGKADTRNAIELLRITKFPHFIYERAKNNVKER